MCVFDIDICNAFYFFFLVPFTFLFFSPFYLFIYSFILLFHPAFSFFLSSPLPTNKPLFSPSPPSLPPSLLLVVIHTIAGVGLKSPEAFSPSLPPSPPPSLPSSPLLSLHPLLPPRLPSLPRHCRRPQPITFRAHPGKEI